MTSVKPASTTVLPPGLSQSVTLSTTQATSTVTIAPPAETTRPSSTILQASSQGRTKS